MAPPMDSRSLTPAKFIAVRTVALALLFLKVAHNSYDIGSGFRAARFQGANHTWLLLFLVDVVATQEF